MNKLHLTLHKKWFNEILSGKKKEEYRENKDYWKKRLEEKTYNTIIFKNGYSKDAPMMEVELLKIEKNESEYVLKLGRILKTKNII